VFLAVIYDETSRLCGVYRGSVSSCLTYCNFLKYCENVINDFLLPYSNNLKRHWEPGLIRLFGKVRKGYRIIELEQPRSLCLKGSNPTRLPLMDSFRTFCWGEIVEELRNIYKLKELINVPIITINPI